ncbi:permease [Nocardioides maradonensis]
MTTPTGPTVLDALSLGAQAANDVIVDTARDTHTAIARRVHGIVGRLVGPAALPVEVLHLGIAGAVYGSIGLTLKGASVGLDRAAAAGLGPQLEDTPRGRFVNAAANGLIGDEILRERPQLAIPLAVRHEGRDVDLHLPADVRRAFPSATGKLVVFLHGLCENESYWSYHRDRTGTTYAETLIPHGWTPVFLRANTGLPLRHNGVALASLMQQVVDVWPTEVDRIVLVGHSLGGLIIRAASAVVADGDAPAPWTRKVTDVITLSTPHLGSWFAVIADHASRMSSRVPEVAAFGRIIDRQAAGIHDLIEGLGEDVPALPHARYRLVTASLTWSPRHPMARAIGDLLVTPRSAAGQDRTRDLFPEGEVLHVGRSDHFSVLNHPEVAAALLRWLR